MTTQVTATQAKAQLLGLLDAVASGEEVKITKHGRTVARLVPAKAKPTRGFLAGVARTNAPDEDLFSTGEEWDAS